MTLRIVGVCFALVAFAWSAKAETDKQSGFQTLKESEQFVKSAFDQQLVMVDEYLADIKKQEDPLSWGHAASERAIILARQGDFENANKYLNSLGDELFVTLEGSQFLSEALYGAGFIKIYSQEIEAALILAEKIRRLPDFEIDPVLRQKRDTLMVAIHSHSGNGILAAQILINKLTSGEAESLPALDQLKLISNISYALITGRDYERAGHYLDLGRSALEEKVESGAITPLQARRVRLHLNNNFAEMLIQQGRYTEVGLVYDALREDADALGAPLYEASADYVAAALAYGQGDLNTAAAKIRAALERGAVLGAPDTLISFYSLNAQILTDLGDHQGALEAFMSRQSIDEANNAQQVRARTDYMNTRDRISAQMAEINRLEAQNAHAEKLRRRDRVISIVTLIALISATGFSLSLFRSRKRLRRYADELILSEQRAQAAAQAKATFLANMSHEIRTPLNGLIGMAQVLAQKDMNTEQRQSVDVMISSGQSLLTIVNDVLDLSKIEAGKMTVSPSEHHLTPLFHDLMSLWRAKADEKGIGLEIEIKPDVPSAILVDAVRLRQCLSNLISNAIKFTAEGQVSLMVDYAENQKTLRMRVQDSGIGIDDQQLSKLFTAFQQGDDSSTRQFGGTGLGLAITRQLARAMGGDVTASSRRGEGSIFTLSIRADAVAAPASPLPENRAEPASEAPLHASALHGRKILLVDDNQVNRMVVKSFLSRRVDSIVEAEHGEEALALLTSASTHFDLILLDMHMPVMDGPTTIAEIRSSTAPWSSMPIIALTADAMEGDRERYLSMGADGYLAKPVIEADLYAEIEATLRQGSRAELARSA